MTLEQVIEYGGACLADLKSAAPGAVLNLQPVRLDLEEVLVTQQFVRWLASRG